MNCAISFKTIFLLDCSSRFSSVCSGQVYELDSIAKNRHNILPLKSISKSLYTCAVEAIFDYSRIVWDLFPNGQKFIKFLGCCPQGTQTVNSWDVCQQNSENLLDCFVNLNLKLRTLKAAAPDFDQLSYLLNGFTQALISLSCEKDTPTNNLTNCGRIILITNIKNENILADFQKQILFIFNAHNQSLFEKRKSSETVIAINQLDVIFVNTYPINTENPFPHSKQNFKLSDSVCFSFYSCFSGLYLSRKLLSLAFEHYGLASTTVSGIPMKEEQNAGSSANYDVEIIHSKEAHTQFFNSKAFKIDSDSFLTTINRDGQDFKTLILKWCTPKAASAVEVSYCIGTHRITAVDMNSRPSMCLINFLHNGKFVNLEMSRIKGSKFYSHMLQSHSGELFIHVLSCTRSLTEDCPSISEGVGGRITDYRINEFSDFMKKNHLVKINNDESESNLKQAEALLKKQTQYWPISYGLTVFFNIREQIPLFYQLISKPRLSDHEVIDLKNIIYNLVSNESKGLSLPIQSNLIRNKNMKKEDYYRILWNEMEHLLRRFSDTAEHKSVLQCLLDCRPKNDSCSFVMAVNEPDISDNTIYQSKVSSNQQNGHFTKINFNNITTSNESLQDLYLNRLEQRNLKRRKEFLGRTNFESKIAKLYSDLNDER